MFKEYYDSGEIKFIAELKQPSCGNYYIFCGLYKEYYESGILKIEGNYQYVDTIECINCYNYFENKNQNYTYRQYVRVGLWKSYYDTGILESTGIYNKVHLIHYIDCDYPASKKSPMGIFCGGSESLEYIKDKEWEYFSKRGNLIKIEYYFNGNIVAIKTYTE